MKQITQSFLEGKSPTLTGTCYFLYIHLPKKTTYSKYTVFL